MRTLHAAVGGVSWHRQVGVWEAAAGNSSLRRSGARAGQSDRHRATAPDRPRLRPFATQCTRCLAAASLRGPLRFHAPIRPITLRYMTTNFNIPLINLTFTTFYNVLSRLVGLYCKVLRSAT